MALGLGACAPGGSTLRSDVDKLQKNISDLRNYQAEQTTRMSSLENDLRELSGRIDELEFARRQGNVHAPELAIDGSEPDSNSAQFANNSAKPGRPSLSSGGTHPLVPQSALKQDELVAAQMPGEIADLFTDALIKLKEGSFYEAIPLLEEAYQVSFGTDYSANIVFWKAVAEEGTADNKKALGSYHEFISRFPKNPRVALALLRQASVFVRLGDSKAAKLTLNKLLSDYPKSDEAATARLRLKDL